MVSDLKSLIADYSNFPKPGILFREISPLLFDVDSRKELLEGFGNYIEHKNITVIAGIDARGFILAGMLAEKYQLPLVMIRKEGKLPKDITHQVSYTLEYGTATLAIREDLLSQDDNVLIVDDVLATGGTLQAAINLVQHCGVQKVYTGVILELLSLGGRQKIAPIEIFSTLQYD